MSDVSLPYGNPGTQGWSGSDTSKERAEHDARSGKAAERQRRVLTYARVGGQYGVTVAEVRDALPAHHGVASSVLSVLHKEGRLARLKARRGKCAIYVLPENVAGRETAPHNANKRNQEAAVLRERLKRMTQESSRVRDKAGSEFFLMSKTRLESLLGEDLF